MSYSRDQHDIDTDIVNYCVSEKKEFRIATAFDYAMEALKDNPVYIFDDKGNKKDVTRDVVCRIEANEKAVARIAAKIEYEAEKRQKEQFEKKAKKAEREDVPDLDRLVDNLYFLNIQTGASYLGLVCFLMQMKYSRLHQFKTDKKSIVYFYGPQEDGKSATARAIFEYEGDFGIPYRICDTSVLTDRHETKLWTSHLIWGDEISASTFERNKLVNAINGGQHDIDPKYENHRTVFMNGNFIFTSNEPVTMQQRRYSAVEFGDSENVNTITLAPGELKSHIAAIVESLPLMKHYGKIYHEISVENQNRLNVLGFSPIMSMGYDCFGNVTPEDNPKPLIFPTHHLYNFIMDKYTRQMIKSDWQKSIKKALEHLTKQGLLNQKSYKSSTKYYEMSAGQYQEICAQYSDPLLKGDKKIEKADLRALLAPYFTTSSPTGKSTDATPDKTVASDKESLSTEEIADTIPETKPSKEISIDLETYSDVDLANGVYKYSESPSFEILLFSYSVNGGEVKTVDFASGEKIPEEIINDLTDNTVIKWAFNANFERICLSVWLQKNYPQYFKGYDSDEETLKKYLDPVSWRCSSVWSRYCGLPYSLADTVKALELPVHKMAAGTSLIKYFSCPCLATKANGGRTRNLPKDDPQKWDLFKDYNKQDVLVEMAVKKALANNPVPISVWDEYVQDQKINDRGIKVDMKMVDAAVELDDKNKQLLTTNMTALTGLENPNSNKQLMGWLKARGITTKSLDKEAIQNLLSTPDLDSDVKEVLEGRLQLAKNSVSKYITMKEMACSDGRVKGSFLFYGATRTGRWTGRGVQFQNLPQNHISGKDLDDRRNQILDGTLPLSENVSSVLSESVRTTVIPPSGYKFIVSDYSQIEPRVLSLMAGETWRLDAFTSGKDLYCASASQMFGVPVEKNGQNADLRVKGKIAELALGYGGTEEALKNMGALKLGLTEEELPNLVKSWRASNKHIYNFWWKVGATAMEAIQYRGYRRIGDLCFECREGNLYIKLPSGRELCYRNVLLEKTEKNGKKYNNIKFFGVTTQQSWGKLGTYGPKLVENIVQAISRDILAYALQNLSNYRVVAHVHDEVVVEVPKDTPVNTITDIMEQTPPWIEGLPLKAEGYECQYYQKQ